MAQNATVHTFVIDLADADRHVYEQLTLRVARHPSETSDFLLTRVLAYCLEYADGIAFSSGLSTPDEPALAVRDATGAYLSWIDIGTPDAARVHRASKAAPRVAIYTHKDPALLIRSLAGERIFGAQALELYAFDRALIAAGVERMQRRTSLGVAVSGAHIFLSTGGQSFDGAIERLALPD